MSENKETMAVKHLFARRGETGVMRSHFWSQSGENGIAAVPLLT